MEMRRGMVAMSAVIRLGWQVGRLPPGLFRNCACGDSRKPGRLKGVTGKTSARHIILRPQKSTSSPSFVCVKHSFLAVVSFMEIYL